MGFRRVLLVVLSAAAIGIACSTGGHLGGGPDGGDGGGWTLPDAQVTATPGPSFTVTNPSQRPTVRLACSSGGDALAYYTDATGGQVRRFHAGAWGDPIALPTYAESMTAVAMSPDGTGTFSWAAGSNDPTSLAGMVDPVNVARLSPAGVWSDTIVAGDGGIGWWQEQSPPYPVVALDDSGATEVAWSRIDQQVDGWPSAIWASHVGTDGVVTTQNIDLPGGMYSSAPSVIARDSGGAVAAWHWNDGTRDQVVVARRVGESWTAPKVVESIERAAGQGLSDRPRLAGGRTGEMVLVYLRAVTPGPVQVMSWRSIDGETWTDPLILASGPDVSWIQLADNGAGGAVVAWSDLLDANGAATIRVFDPLSGWSQLFVPVPGGINQPLVAEHPDGHVAVLNLEQGTFSVVLQRFDPGTGWRPSELVESGQGGLMGLCYAGETLMAAWSNGQAVAAALP